METINGKVKQILQQHKGIKMTSASSTKASFFDETVK